VLYLLVLVACVAVTLPLELLLGARVYRRPWRLLLTLVPVLAVFAVWDVLAIHAGQWTYHRLTGVRFGNLPLEEVLFFLVIPTCAVLTLEAVRRRRPQWQVGDEPVDAPVDAP
jgi:lycopene cyclase domain-containing protein